MAVKPRGDYPRQPTSQNQFSHVRWLVLAASLGLLMISLVLRLQPSLLSKDTALASDAFGKVGIVLMCAWLAWPAVELLWKAPNGMSLVVAFLFAGGLFIYRPKTLYLTGPFLIIATILVLLLGWIKKLRK